MKGLLIREFAVLKSTLLWYALVFAVLFVIGAVLGNEGFFLGVGAVASVSLPAVSVAADEKEQWLKFALSGGCSPTKLAASKYIIPGMAGVLVCGLTALIIALMPDNEMSWSMVPLTFTFAFVLLAVMVPLYVKVGIEKGRLIGMICLVAVIAGTVALFGVVNTSSASGVIDILAYCSPILGVGFTAGSVLVTAKIIADKEF